MVVPLSSSASGAVTAEARASSILFKRNTVARLILTTLHRLLNASTVFAFERPFLACLSLSPYFVFERHQDL